MDCLFRRPSGVYVARIVIPVRHRAALQRTEFLASTGTRELSIAKVVANHLLAQWRRQILALDGQPALPMDVIKIAAGSPLLGIEGHIGLDEASSLSGIEVKDILRQASARRINLYMRIADRPGNLIPKCHAQSENDTVTR